MRRGRWADDVTVAGRPDTLEEILRAEECVALERALLLIRAMALAIDALHARQATHGALSPSSVQVVGEERVVLLPAVWDAAVGDVAASARRYWSPQRLAGEPVRPADDLYALGLIASELLDRTSADAAEPLPAEVPAVLQAQRSWAPSERYASGAELAQELDRAAAQPIKSQEPSWAAARRVAQAREAHRLALETPPTHRPRRRTPPAPLPSHPIIRSSNYPDMPLAGRWVAIVVAVLCSVYLFPLFFMLFPRG